LASTPRIILIMGVSGSGKTTIGRRVAAALGWPYFEADDFHSVANKEKMAQGIPLNDADREPWLATIRAKMDECRAAGQSAVFTCSALKEKYRAALLTPGDDTLLVYLRGSFETIQARVAQRQGHYMKAGLVESQFEALEEPKDAFTLDVTLAPEEIVQAILARVGAVSDKR
jgi:gluconokinase